MLVQTGKPLGRAATPVCSKSIYNASTRVIRHAFGRLRKPSHLSMFQRVEGTSMGEIAGLRSVELRSSAVLL